MYYTIPKDGTYIHTTLTSHIQSNPVFPLNGLKPLTSAAQNSMTQCSSRIRFIIGYKTIRADLSIVDSFFFAHFFVPFECGSALR